MNLDGLKEFEKESFIFCDTDGDQGLSWDEVENCEVKKVDWKFSYR